MRLALSASSECSAERQTLLTSPVNEKADLTHMTSEWKGRPHSYHQCMKRQTSLISPMNEKADLTHITSEWKGRPHSYDQWMKRQTSLIWPVDEKADLTHMTSEWKGRPHSYDQWMKRQTSLKSPVNEKADFTHFTSECPLCDVAMTWSDSTRNYASGFYETHDWQGHNNTQVYQCIAVHHIGIVICCDTW